MGQSNYMWCNWNYRGGWHQACPPIDTHKGIQILPIQITRQDCPALLLLVTTSLCQGLSAHTLLDFLHCYFFQRGLSAHTLLPARSERGNATANNVVSVCQRLLFTHKCVNNSRFGGYDTHSRTHTHNDSYDHSAKTDRSWVGGYIGHDGVYIGHVTVISTFE